MMHRREKSDPAIVAGKPTNKVASATAESVEPRAGAERNAGQQSTHLRWNAYGKPQGKGRRRSSPRFCTTSTSICYGNRSLRSNAKPPPEWMG
jgi:hypothetical protein